MSAALNQHGEVLPVGGINKKIEGFFDICAAQQDNAQASLLKTSVE